MAWKPLVKTISVSGGAMKSVSTATSTLATPSRTTITPTSTNTQSNSAPQTTQQTGGSTPQPAGGWGGRAEGGGSDAPSSSSSSSSSSYGGHYVNDVLVGTIDKSGKEIPVSQLTTSTTPIVAKAGDRFVSGVTAEGQAIRDGQIINYTYTGGGTHGSLSTPGTLLPPANPNTTSYVNNSGNIVYSTPGVGNYGYQSNPDAFNQALATGVGVSSRDYNTEAANQYIVQQAKAAGIDTNGKLPSQLTRELNNIRGGSDSTQSFTFTPTPITATKDLYSGTEGTIEEKQEGWLQTRINRPNKTYAEGEVISSGIPGGTLQNQPTGKSPVSTIDTSEYASTTITPAPEEKQKQKIDYSQYYSSIITTSPKVNTMLSDYKNMSRAPVSQTEAISSQDTFKPHIASMSLSPLGTTPSYLQKPTTTPAVTGTVTRYKEMVSGPTMPIAYAERETTYPTTQASSMPKPSGPVQVSSTISTPWGTSITPSYLQNKPVEISAVQVEKGRAWEGDIITKSLVESGKTVEQSLGGGVIGKVAGFATDMTFGSAGRASLVAQKTMIGGSGATTTGEKLSVAIDAAALAASLFTAGAGGAAIKGGATALKAGRGVSAAYNVGKGIAARKLVGEQVYVAGRIAKAGIRGLDEGLYGLKEAQKIAKVRYGSAVNTVKTTGEKLIYGATKYTGKGISAVGKQYTKYVRPVARALDKPSQLVESGIDKFMTSGSRGSNLLKGVSRIVVANTEIKAASAASMISTPREKEAFENVGMTKEETMVIGNRAEIGAYNPEGTDFVTGALKTGGYYSGITGDGKAFEQGIRDSLPAGTSQKDADTIVSSATRSRNLLRVTAGLAMVKAEHGGNVAGGRSVTSYLKTTGSTLVKERAKSIPERIKYGFRTRAAVGGPVEGAISSYGIAKTKPMYKMTSGIYQTEAIPEGQEYKPVFLDFKVPGTDVTVSPLTASARTSKTAYSLGTTGAVIVGAASGSVFAGTFGGFEEGVLGKTGVIPKKGVPSLPRRMTTDALGYGLDFPGEPIGDAFTATVGQASRTKIKTFGVGGAGPSSSFSQTAQSSWQAAMSDQLLDSTASKGLNKNFAFSDEQQRMGMKTYAQTKAQEKQKEKSSEKQSTDPFQQEKQQEKQSTDPFQQEKQQEKEQTTIFTPPLFPPPLFPNMGGGEGRGTGPSYTAPRKQKYQADFQAKALGQYAPTAGSQSYYTGAERRYLQGPGPQSGNSAQKQQEQYNPFSPKQQQNPFQAAGRAGSKSNNKLMDLSFGL